MVHNRIQRLLPAQHNLQLPQCSDLFAFEDFGIQDLCQILRVVFPSPLGHRDYFWGGRYPEQSCASHVEQARRGWATLRPFRMKRLAQATIGETPTRPLWAHEFAAATAPVSEGRRRCCSELGPKGLLHAVHGRTANAKHGAVFSSKARVDSGSSCHSQKEAKNISSGKQTRMSG